MSEVINFNEYNMLLEGEEWGIVIDVSDIWAKYSDGEMSIFTFCKRYREKILEKKENIINKIGQESWNELNEIIEKMVNVKKQKDAHPIFNKIYDWADDNEVLIQTNSQNEIF